MYSVPICCLSSKSLHVTSLDLFAYLLTFLVLFVLHLPLSSFPSLPSPFSPSPFSPSPFSPSFPPSLSLQTDINQDRIVRNGGLSVLIPLLRSADIPYTPLISGNVASVGILCIDCSTFTLSAVLISSRSTEIRHVLFFWYTSTDEY